MIELCTELTDVYNREDCLFGPYIRLIDSDKLRIVIQNYLNSKFPQISPDNELLFVKSLLAICKDYYFSDELADNILLSSVLIPALEDYSRTILIKPSIPLQFSGLKDTEVLEYINNSIERSLRYSVDEWDLFKYLDNIKLELINIEGKEGNQYIIDEILINKLNQSDLIIKNLLECLKKDNSITTAYGQLNYKLTINKVAYEISIKLDKLYGCDVDLRFRKIKNSELDYKLTKILSIFQLKLWKQFLTN